MPVVARAFDCSPEETGPTLVKATITTAWPRTPVEWTDAYEIARALFAEDAAEGFRAAGAFGTRVWENLPDDVAVEGHVFAVAYGLIVASAQAWRPLIEMQDWAAP
jgi:hypothetical protein